MAPAPAWRRSTSRPLLRPSEVEQDRVQAVIQTFEKQSLGHERKDLDATCGDDLRTTARLAELR